MGKDELKKDLELYKQINENLTIKISYFLLGKENFIIARKKEGFTEEVIEESMKIMLNELDMANEALRSYYLNNEDVK